MNVTSAGIGSGINIRELVDNLLEAESKDKIKKFDADEATSIAKITGYGNLKSAMADFSANIERLKGSNQFEMRSASATTANNQVIIAPNATSDAQAGNYSVEVTQLAYGQKSCSIGFPESFSVVGTGTLTFNIDGFHYSFDINNANNTLLGINDTINAQSGATGISSSLIATDTGTKIVFSSSTGTNNAFTVSVTNDADANNANASGLSRLASPNLTTLQAPQNANVKIDGVPISSDSNTISSAITGVTFDLVNLNVGQPVTLSVGIDVASAKQAVVDFVDGYNKVFEALSKLTQFDLSRNKNNMGILIGDATLRNVEFQMRRILTDIATTQPAGFSTLSQIGITSDIYTGKLTIDESMLDEALYKNFDAVGSLLMDSEDGVLTKMDSFLEGYIDFNGVLKSREDGLKASLELIDEQRISLERHLKSLEKKLIVQFTAMDTVVAKLKSLSNFLETQLEKLVDPLMFKK